MCYMVRDDAKLGALTQVMKGEYIPEKSFFHGCPASFCQYALIVERVVV